MKKALFFTFCFFLFYRSFAQDTITNKVSLDQMDKNRFSDIHKKRLKYVVSANVVAYGGTTIALYNSWYKDYPQSNFHFFNDNKEWLQVDKVGHAYSAYSEGRASIEMWKWTGMERRKRIWLGGLSGLAYQTVIEVLDGFSSEWGFSWGDYTANILGSSLLISQELVWNEQRVSLKFSFHKNTYANPVLEARANDIYGSGTASRMLKDYNAQTYWLSANLQSFFKESNLPAWLNIAVGYGADNMYSAVNNTWIDKNGEHQNFSNLPRYRQFYLSPDVDFTKIKTNSKFLKATFFVLNSFKFPAPSIELSNSKFKYHWLHF